MEDFFLVIDSRKETIHINVENVDSFSELEDGGKL
jgi:hypothetical protein